MNTERKVESAIGVISLVAGALIVTTVQNYFALIIGILVFIVGALTILLLEIYFRIQHNLDKTQSDFIKIVSELNVNLKTAKDKIEEENKKLHEDSLSYLNTLYDKDLKEIIKLSNQVDLINKEIKVSDKNHDSKLSLLSENFSKSIIHVNDDIKIVGQLVKEVGNISTKNEAMISDIKFAESDIFKLILGDKIKDSLKKKNTVTVLFGVKDRFDNRIDNALKSIRKQDYPKKLIKVVMVDYGSKPEFVNKYKLVCKKYNVEYIREENAGDWNRSRCLNIGIKNIDTKYILISDADIIFAKNYISEAIRTLEENHYQFAYSPMNYAGEKDILDNTDVNKDYNIILNKTTKGQHYSFKGIDFRQGMSIVFGLSQIFSILGGYDENFKLWGCEDDDFLARALTLGIKLNDISKNTSHIHEWHPKFDGVNKDKNLESQIEKNKEYLKQSRPVLRDIKA
jgi:predicted glycosyltransferase involved in capsule biosynthesis